MAKFAKQSGGVMWIAALLLIAIIFFYVVGKAENSPQRKKAAMLREIDKWQSEGYVRHYRAKVQRIPYPDPSALINGTCLPVCRLRIDYTDRDNSRTVRIVDVVQFVYNSSEGDGIMQAWCNLRKSLRSFKFSGIASTTVAATGEVVENLGEWLTEIAAPMVPAGYQEIYALYYLGKADGTLGKKEHAIIQDYAQDNGIIADFSEYEKIKSIMKKWKPRQDVFDKCLATIAGMERERKQRLIDAMAAMILADKTATRQEGQVIRLAASRLDATLPPLPGV